MTEELINMNDEYETRDGREVRVLCVDRKNRNRSVVALIQGEIGEYPETYTKYGEIYEGAEDDRDLIKKSKFRPGDVWLCRDGKTKVEILRTDLNNEEPILGVVTECTESQWSCQWFKNGTYYGRISDRLDLITKLS